MVILWVFRILVLVLILNVLIINCLGIILMFILMRLFLLIVDMKFLGIGVLIGLEMILVFLFLIGWNMVL